MSQKLLEGAMKVLIFGATGGIGKWVVDYLLHTVHFPKKDLFLASRHNIPYFEKQNLQHFCVDISDTKSFEELPPHVDAVIDLAGAMPARMEGYHPRTYIDVNIIGTLNVLEYCKNAGVDRILFTQSFGDIKQNSEASVILKSNSPRVFDMNDDHTVYVLSKNFAVDLIEHYHQMYGIKNFIFRLPTVHSYSPDVYFYHNGIKKPIGYRYLIQKAISGETLEVWGDPNRKKDMVYVKDLAQMLFLALSTNVESGVYNVGTGVGTTLQDQIEGILEVFSPKGLKNNMVFCPEKPNAPAYIMDISNAKRDLGYQPNYLYKEMLKDIKKEMDLNRFEV